MLKESYNMLDRRRHAILKKMAKTGPFIMATASQHTMKCANTKCACQKDKGKRHPTFRLSWTDAQGDGSCYVPVDIRKDVLEWIENYWTIKEYMKEMTDLSRRMIKIYAKTIGRVKKKRVQNKEQIRSKGRARNKKIL